MNLLVPIDFSKCANHALKYAINICEKGDNISLHVITTYSIPSSSRAGNFFDISDKIHEGVNQDLQETIAKLEISSAIDIQYHVIYGSAVDIIKDYAKQNSIDLIVMGTKGATGVKEVLLGSVTSGVIGRTKVPLLAIPEDAETNIEKIVLAYDNKIQKLPSQDETFRQLVTNLGKSIEVVYVVDESKKDDYKYDEDSYLNDLFGNIQYNFHLLEGNNVEETILNYVEENEVGMLVTINQNYSFFEKIFHRSMSKKIAMHSDIPLLVLKEQ